MVDEYQDTNPIQENIYFKLANNTHNLCVVGDDDQALYRFRGGTVDCMITFDQACNRKWKITLSQEQKRFLSSNYRSHPRIAKYCDAYISSFQVMRRQDARVEGKPNLNPKSGISGSYPDVAYITGRTVPTVASNFARLVRNLLDNQIIEKPRQCVLLMKSVRETSRNAGPFAEALRNEGIRPYNPRSRTFLEQEEIRVALGAFVSIVDPTLSALSQPMGLGIRKMVQEWLDAYNENSDTDLSDYVNRSLNGIGLLPPNHWLGANIMDILYHILSREPFHSWKNDPEKSYRL